ncbi:hypothetical protein LUZ60_000236 [Juncus effusus]|nr:hypothetical protein LUZ60_000236 [Juncus effusus]
MKLTMENIKAFIMDMFVAGTDTTSLTMEWTLSELINHPHVLQKAAQEIDTIVGKERLVNETDISQLPYLQAIIKETLRLHPTGPIIARLCTENCTVNNYTVTAGTTLFVNVWALGRDPECWENSSEFCPERFMGQEMDVRGQQYQFLPFGTGRRICPGITLAMLVVQTTIGVMIQCFDWKMKDGGLADMAEGAGMTLSRAKPLLCVPVPRVDVASFTLRNLVRIK